MSHYGDETRLLRRRHDELLDELARLPKDDTESGQAILIQTTHDAVYPTTAGVMYAVQRLDAVVASDAEGTVPTFNTYTSKFHALNVGSAIPPEGTKRLAFLWAGIWCFQWNG